MIEEKSEHLVYFFEGRYIFDVKPRISGTVYYERDIPKLLEKLAKALEKEIHYWEGRIRYYKGLDLVRSCYTQNDIDESVQDCIDQIQKVKDKQAKYVFKPCKVTYETI